MRKFSIPLIAPAILILLLTGLALAKTPRAKPDPTPLPVEPPTATARPTVTPSPTPTPMSTPTPMPSTTPTPTVTPVPPSPTPSPTPTPPIDIPTYPPNEMGDVLVLVYHAIGRPEGRWQRTPENLHGDLEYLIAHGYYPVNLIDYATGNLDHVPRGRRPIVLTFDDSSRGHFRYLEGDAIGDGDIGDAIGGGIDPDCAVAILMSMHEQYGDYWPLRATFYVLLSSGEEPGARLFRQADLAAQKVRALVDWGMEVGSHTITHPNLSQVTPAEVQWELAVSQNRIEALIPGYEVRSFALPFGDYPSDVSLLREGHADSDDDSVELDYHYDAVVRLGAWPAPSPFSSEFDPFYIPRVQAIQSQLDYWLSYYEKHPERYHVSAGGDDNNDTSHYKSEVEP